MKRNQFFNILKVQHVKDASNQSLNRGDLITPENCAILLSKMVFESRGADVLMTYCCREDYEIAIRYGVYWLLY